MVDNAVDVQDGKRTQPALAAPAIGNHLDAGCLQRFQHSPVARDIDLHAQSRNFHRERLGGEETAIAEGLETKLIDWAAAVPPIALGRLQHTDWPAHIKLAAGRKLGDLCCEIDFGALPR